MNTVALLLMARMALAWICVLGGNTPFASLVIIDLGSVRSCITLAVCTVISPASPPLSLLPFGGGE